jgi:hypothetical protein
MARMTTSVAGETDGWIDQYRYARNTCFQNQCYYKEKQRKSSPLAYYLPTPPPPPRHVTRLSLDSKAKSRFQTKASTSSRRLENIGFSGRYACVTRTKAKILNTNEIYLLHQKKKEKKLSTYISTDQIHDLPNFL